MLLEEFDYYLPEELIAQYPHQKRDEAKLLVYKNNIIEHKKFYDIINYLHKDDVLVLNNTKVLSSRIIGRKKETKARIEIFLTKKIDNYKWECLIKPLKRLKENSEIIINNEIYAKLIFKDKNGEKNIVEFNKNLSYEDLDKIGYTPLPPYIKRDYKNYSEINKKQDAEYYQTIYAEKYGSVASPTAGLHFTSELLEKIKQKGVIITYVTLDVSLGTFKPVKEKEIEKHKIHSEKFYVSQDAADIINNRKGKLIAVGTTTTRVIETLANKYNKIIPTEEETNLFIYPPYKFKMIDALITNFHLPKSTLLMLVSSFIGIDNMRKIYNEAIEKKYLFYSFGDAMYLENMKK